MRFAEVVNVSAAVAVTPGLELMPGVTDGARVQVGQPLFRSAPHHAWDGVASSSSHAPAT